jgi:hypothetical protein
MESLATAPRRRCGYGKIALAACLFAGSMARQAVGGEIVGAPIDLSAFVHEGLLPGGTIFEDTHAVTGALSTPKESAEYLYLASKGENLSGRSTNIQGAFAAPSHPRSPNRTAMAASGSRPGSARLRATPIRRQSGSSSPGPPGSRTSPTTGASPHPFRCT